MFKRLPLPKSPIITEENTHISWTRNLDISVSTRNGQKVIDGMLTHAKLNKTLRTIESKFPSQVQNKLVASITLIASKGDQSRAFTIPIRAIFGARFYPMCFTNSGVLANDWQEELEIMDRHISQRMSVAHQFMGLKIPDQDHPSDFSEFKWRTYHSEQALIEYLWKRESLNDIMRSMIESGMKKSDFDHIDAVILDINQTSYTCEFCEVSLFGMQAPKHKYGWLSQFEKTLRYGGYIFPESGIPMTTRVSAYKSFPRLRHIDIENQCTPLVTHPPTKCNNRVVMAMDSNFINKAILRNIQPYGNKEISVFSSGTYQGMKRKRA